MKIYGEFNIFHNEFLVFGSIPIMDKNSINMNASFSQQIHLLVIVHILKVEHGCNITIPYVYRCVLS